MKLEKAIHQNTFNNEYHKAHLSILYTASWLTQHSSAVLKGHGLTWQQFNILRILRGQSPKPASVKLLTERMIDKNSNASRLVDKLLAKGLVERITSVEDRRRVDISITSSGLELLSAADTDLEPIIVSMHGDLTPDEAELLSQLLDKMRAKEQ